MEPCARRCAGRAQRRESMEASWPLRCPHERPPVARRAHPHIARRSLGSPVLWATGVWAGVPGRTAIRGLSRRGRRSGGQTREDHRPGAEIRRRPPRRQTQGERARPARCSVDAVSSAGCVTGDHGSLAQGAPPRTDVAERIEGRTLAASAPMSSRCFTGARRRADPRGRTAPATAPARTAPHSSGDRSGTSRRPPRSPPPTARSASSCRR